MPMGKGTYGSQRGRPSKSMTIKKKPMSSMAMKKKKKKK